MRSQLGAVLPSLLYLHHASAKVMNAGGVPYRISNPDSAAAAPYSTDFEANVAGPVEHFDMYGEVRTIYSQTYWTRNAPIPLPEELVKRFANGGVMAITGYEIDQVTHDNAPPPPPGDKLGGFTCYPSCDASDQSVPTYHAYNHHYFAWLVGSGAEVYDLERPGKYPNPSWTGVREVKANPQGVPSSIVFKENPGGEYRKSYHGYPSGYAQLLHEPTTWIFEPMQIDTHPRDGTQLTDQVGYKQWLLPAASGNGSVTELYSGSSPLLECPCTDRITKHVNETSGESYVLYTQDDRTVRVDYHHDCNDEPRGDMLRHGNGVGTNGPNAACNVTTYHGGTFCCQHTFLLTDKAQQPYLREDLVDRYYLKFRYYFQTYRPAHSPSASASHQLLHHWVFLIDAQINDYEEAHDDERTNPYGTPSLGRIEARLVANQLCDAGCDGGPNGQIDGAGVQPAKDGKLHFKTITPLVITPHCHAPSCVREELWNDDTGELLCNVTADYGDARYGALSDVFNERGYLAIPPCLFGYQPGLRKPFSLGPDTKLRAVKYFNNTYRHLGQMAQWTGLAVYEWPDGTMDGARGV